MTNSSMQHTYSAITNIAAILLFVFLTPLCVLFIASYFDRQHNNAVAPAAHAIAHAHPGLRCVKCNGAMEPGFVIDRTHGRSEVSTWIPGAPEVGTFGTLKDNNAEPVVTFRCAKCGYAESYTR